MFYFREIQPIVSNHLQMHVDNIKCRYIFASVHLLLVNNPKFNITYSDLEHCKSKKNESKRFKERNLE